MSQEARTDEAQPAARVADARQAALLLDIKLRPLLGQLMERACSAAEVAKKQGVNLQRAHYLLGRLHAAGVVQLESVQPRAGRAIKRYRMAGRWFVPFRVTGAETLEAFLGAQILPRMERFVNLTVRQVEAGFTDWGFWLQQDGEGSSLNMGGPDGPALELFAGGEPFTLNIGTMWLSPEHAVQLKHRLLAVMDEFAPLHDLAQTPYTVGLLMARGDVG